MSVGIVSVKIMYDCLSLFYRQRLSVSWWYVFSLITLIVWRESDVGLLIRRI